MGSKDRPPLPDMDAIGRQYLARAGAERRQRGAYYTPLSLARATVKRALSCLDSRPAAVLDPACGCGVFLVAAQDALLRGGLSSQAAASSLFGVDTDGLAAALARDGLAAAGAPRSCLGRQVRRADGLTGPWPGPTRYDLILGNPPHLGEEDHRATLAAAARATGLSAPRGDLSFHFAARALDLLAENGVLALILPSSVADADSATALRARLAREATLLAVIDLGSGSLFGPDVGQPTVLVLARKETFRSAEYLRLEWTAEPAPEQVAAAVRGQAVGSARQWHAESPARSGARWPQQPMARRTAARGRIGERLGDRFEVHQGVVPGPARATAKAVARVLREQDEEETPARIRAWAEHRGFEPGAGVFVLDRGEVEALLAAGVPEELARPFVRPRAIRGARCPRDTGERLLYLTADTCPDLSAWPALARHLERFRPLLERRRETRLGLRAWHHLHWPRREAIFLAPRVLVPRQCRSPVAAYCKRPLFVDLGCNVISGPDAAALRRLAQYLNGPEAAEWLATRGKRKAGIAQIDAGVLAGMPVPSHD